MMQRFPLYCLMASGLIGCAFETPQLDAQFGKSNEQAQITQAISGNRASPNMQMDARALHNGMVNYMGDQQAPQALQGILSGGSGSNQSR